MKIIVIDPLEANFPPINALIVTAYAGCEVITIGDEAGYRAMLAGAPPGLLIITETPGWCECLALLKELQLNWPGVPVVMIAGDGSEERAAAAIKAGLSAYLARYNLEQLLKIVGTNLKQADRRQLNDAPLRRVLEQMPALLYAYNQDEGVVFWNREVERVTGYSADEVIGNPHIFAMLFTNMAERALINEVWARQPGDFRNLELELTAKDGSRRIVSWSNLSRSTPIAGWDSWGVGIDVTARQQAEAALRRREQEYALLLEHTPDVITRIDRDLRIQYVSPSIERIFGMPVEAFIGKTTRDMGISEQLTERWEQAARHVLATGQRVTFDFTFTRSDEVQIFEAHIAPSYSTDSAVEAILGVVREVTVHRRSEQYQQFLAEASMVLASSLDYAAILQHAVRLVVPFLADSCAIDLIEDAQVRRVAAAHQNPDKEQLLYYLARQFPVDLAHDPFANLVRSGEALLVPDFMADSSLLPAAHEEFMRRVGPTRSLIMVPLIVRGEPLGAMIFGITDTPRRYGSAELGLAEELVRRLTITIDNARLLAESQRLTRQSHAQAVELEAIFQQAPVGLAIYEVFPEVRCLRHNALALEQASEYWQRRGSYEGVLLSELLDPAAYEQTCKLFEAALRSGRTVTTDEYTETASPDSQTRYYACSATPLPNEDGEPTTLLVAAVEITGRKRAEEERLVLERKLLDARKLESLGVLAGGIAHDFNNLLTVMIGNIDLALLDAPPNSPCAAAIRQIEQSAQRAAGLTRQLLTYAGGGKADIQPLELNTMIVEMRVQLRAVLPRLIELNTSLLDGLPQVSVDQAQIQQLLMNLVVNAAEAIGDMPGTITIRTDTLQPEQAWLAGALLGDTLSPGRYVLLEVSDTGHGMDIATQERIFEPFFTTRFAGRGLGLSAVLGIVRAHRGMLKVVSEPGHGATFTILLPCLAVVQQVGESATMPAVRTRAPAILVVDDEPGVREVVSAIMRRLNFRVLSASDGLEALDLFRAHPDEIDCVVLDMVMPHMDGAQTFVELQQIKPQVPVIVISGYSPDEMLQRFGSERPAGFLQKPFTPRDLRTVVQQLIGQAG